MNLGIKNENPLSDQIYVAITLPIIFGLCAVSSPSLSIMGVWILGGYIVGNIVFIIISKINRLHYYIRVRIIFLIAQIDVSVICIVILFWRNVTHNYLLTSFLLIISTTIAYTGYRYRYLINQEIKEPKTRTGKLVYGLGTVGSGVAGILAYVFSQGAGSAVVISILFTVMQPVVLIFHAQWVYIKEPYFGTK